MEHAASRHQENNSSIKDPSRKCIDQLRISSLSIPYFLFPSTLSAIGVFAKHYNSIHSTLGATSGKNPPVF